MQVFKYIPAVVITILLGCGSGDPLLASRESSNRSGYQLVGVASYYADDFHGHRTSNGEVYDEHSLTAAHRTLPFNTMARVVNLKNGKSVVVRVNDRGPFKKDRVIDLSLEAAKRLGLVTNGTASVRIEVLTLGHDSE